MQGFTKANMRLLWDKSDPMNVHPYKKGLALAKAMGIKLRDRPSIKDVCTAHENLESPSSK